MNRSSGFRSTGKVASALSKDNVFNGDGDLDVTF